MSGRNIRPLIFCPFHAFPRVGQGVGQAVAPHFDPHCFQHFCNKKAPKTEVFDAFWSCWADSNRRPHPYQLQNDCFSLLLVIVTYCLQPFDCNGCVVFFAIVCRFVLYLKSSCFLIPVSVLCRFLKMQSDKTSSLFGSISEHGRRGDSSPVPFSRIYSAVW